MIAKQIGLCQAFRVPSSVRQGAREIYISTFECTAHSVEYYVHEANCRIDLLDCEHKGSDLLRSEERFPMAAK